jgi:hypothetical protein
MSTRCQIGFYEPEATNLKEWEALIYRHSDGYPDSEHGVLANIAPILEDFNKNRGLDDVEYAAAWLVAKLKTDYLNIGICKDFHGDIEYFYAVYPDRIDVYSTTSAWLDNLDPDKWEKIQTVEL